MIIEAVEENSKPLSYIATDVAVKRSEDGLDYTEGPPPYTCGQQLHLAMPPLPSHTIPSTLTSDDMPSPNPAASSPLSPSSPHSPYQSPFSTQQQQRLYSHSALHATTIPYDFAASTSHDRSALLSPAVSARPSRRAVARFFTSFFVALGIIFLWLICVQLIRILIFGHNPMRWRPPPHHGGPPPPHHGGPWRREVPIVKPSFGTSRPHGAHLTRYASLNSVTSTTLPSPTEAASAGGVLLTADR